MALRYSTRANNALRQQPLGAVGVGLHRFGFMRLHFARAAGHAQAEITQRQLGQQGVLRAPRLGLRIFDARRRRPVRRVNFAAHIKRPETRDRRGVKGPVLHLVAHRQARDAQHDRRIQRRRLRFEFEPREAQAVRRRRFFFACAYILARRREAFVVPLHPRRRRVKTQCLAPKDRHKERRGQRQRATPAISCPDDSAMRSHAPFLQVSPRLAAHAISAQPGQCLDDLFPRGCFRILDPPIQDLRQHTDHGLRSHRQV